MLALNAAHAQSLHMLNTVLMARYDGLSMSEELNVLKQCADEQIIVKNALGFEACVEYTENDDDVTGSFLGLPTY